MTAENPVELNYRSVTVEDIPTVVEFRTRMFRELGWRDEARLFEVEPLFAAYLAEALPAGDCAGMVAEYLDADGSPKPAGTVVLIWQRVPPGVRNLAGIQAYALGMYVEPELRRRGIAKELMLRSIDCAADHGASLVALHASEFGRPLYESIGFTMTEEMRFFTRNAPPSEWGAIEESSD
jgi:GNAT superfamily N-acetyltransferase